MNACQTNVNVSIETKKTGQRKWILIQREKKVCGEERGAGTLCGLVFQAQVKCVNHTNVRQVTRIVANAPDLTGRTSRTTSLAYRHERNVVNIVRRDL